MTLDPRILRPGGPPPGFKIAVPAAPPRSGSLLARAPSAPRVPFPLRAPFLPSRDPLRSPGLLPRPSRVAHRVPSSTPSRRRTSIKLPGMAPSRRRRQEGRRGRQHANKPRRAPRRPHPRALCPRGPSHSARVRRRAPGPAGSRPRLGASPAPAPCCNLGGSRTSRPGRSPLPNLGRASRERGKGKSPPNRRVPSLASRGEAERETGKQGDEAQEAGAGLARVPRSHLRAPDSPHLGKTRTLGDLGARIWGPRDGHNRNRGAKLGLLISKSVGRLWLGRVEPRDPESVRCVSAGGATAPRPLGLEVRLRLLFWPVAVI